MSRLIAPIGVVAFLLGILLVLQQGGAPATSPSAAVRAVPSATSMASARATASVAVEWEDITAYSRTALPDDFEPYRLRKLTHLSDTGALVSLQIESA